MDLKISKILRIKCIHTLFKPSVLVGLHQFVFGLSNNSLCGLIYSIVHFALTKFNIMLGPHPVKEVIKVILHKLSCMKQTFDLELLHELT